MHKPASEEFSIAQRLVADQFNSLYDSEMGRYIRSGQAAKDAAEQNRKDSREIDAWMEREMR